MRWRLALVPIALVAVLAGCEGAAFDKANPDEARGKVRVLATTEILADIARNVGGRHIHAESLVPPGGDPHSYEPTPADATRIARADVTFTNHLLLEEHALIKAIDSNARRGTPNVSLAEAAESYGARVIPLVEDLGLDVLWLGLRVRGDGKARGATRASDVQLSATQLKGPGRLVAYLTKSLGEPDRYFDSGDGFDHRDSTILPPAAHTHLNWAFTKPGIYKLRLTATLRVPRKRPQQLGSGVFTFAVGVDPAGVARGRTVLDDGHTDLTVDLDSGRLYAYSDIRKVGSEQAQIPAAESLIDVPTRAAEKVPADRRFAFLGKPGGKIYQLPQAVLGKHVHGEIDPHLWQDVANVRAYAQLIRDTLIKQDPANERDYRKNTRAYLAQLEQLDAHVARRLKTIPAGSRQLITTHDAFGYLAEAYDMKVAGFVVPNPAQEPSAEQVERLTDTIRNLGVRSVFLEPNLAHRAGVLKQVARDQGVRVCKLYGDAFDHQARDYVAMMRHNADELVRCLGGRS